MKVLFKSGASRRRRPMAIRQRRCGGRRSESRCGRATRPGCGARPDGSALLVLPGGGYGFLSVQNEGMELARRHGPLGTQVFVLTYRLPGEGWLQRGRVPLQDAQRAMRVLRSMASRFSADADRIGVIGFSARGHGFGLRSSPDVPVSRWPVLFATWMRGRKASAP